MKKQSAVVYDKWLHSLGGGEIVACQMAHNLINLGYNVLFISGKKVSPQIIQSTLNIDLTDVSFEQVWNNETEIKQLTNGKDLFINTSFMDYAYGFAKKNLYYTHFPTPEVTGFRNLMMNKLFLPKLSKYIRPIEFIEGPANTVFKNGRLSYHLGNQTKLAFSFITNKKQHSLKFSLFLENFYFSLLDQIRVDIHNATLVNRTIRIDAQHNVIHFMMNFIPNQETIYLQINIDFPNPSIHGNEKDKVYLIYPRILPYKSLDRLLAISHERISNRLRAGIFQNIVQRLESYDVILANSDFTKNWIQKYWRRTATVLHPPVEMLFEKHEVDLANKQKWVCSVGRFFTFGHGKKQEVLIKAFKIFYNQGHPDWQLHLVGGLENDKNNARFAERLKKSAQDYPIYFHFNANRIELEEILLKSKFYWHATGFKANEKKHPIKFEHFGIAPIEAISAGCIPILFNGGGLREIIQGLNLNSMHLFNSVEELWQNSAALINTPYPFEQIKKDLTKSYSQEAFAQKLSNQIKPNR